MNDNKNTKKPSPQKPKVRKQFDNTNVLESFKGIGSSATSSFKKDLLGGIGRDFTKQLLGRYEKRSGEITPGNEMKMDEVLSGQAAENEKLQKQLNHERALQKEEQALIKRKEEKLRMQLHAVKQEILTLAATTQNLSKQVEVAAVQAPVNPGIYHIVFFEKLLEFIKSFRKSADEANVWLQSTNMRAAKKSYWGSYKKHGAKFLLSSEHYLSRSAG